MKRNRYTMRVYLQKETCGDETKQVLSVRQYYNPQHPENTQTGFTGVRLELKDDGSETFRQLAEFANDVDSAEAAA